MEDASLCTSAIFLYCGVVEHNLLRHLAPAFEKWRNFAEAECERLRRIRCGSLVVFATCEDINRANLIFDRIARIQRARRKTG